MTIVDANILLYAYDADSPHHLKAAKWVEKLFRGPSLVGLTWPVLWAFIRIRTNARLGTTPRPPAETISFVREWLAQPGVVIVSPGPRHADMLEAMITEGGAVGPKVSDAVLAALALEHGATLASSDRDFSRFPNLRWVNPLV